MAERKPTISFDDFLKLDLRAATIVEAREHPNADKLLCMTVDVGGEQRQLVAGLKGHYTPEELTGKQIAVVLNLEPRKMRGEMSEGMLLAAVCDEGDQQKVVLLTLESQVPPGASIS